MATLDQGQWPRVMCTKGNASGSNRQKTPLKNCYQEQCTNEIWPKVHWSTLLPKRKATSEKLRFFWGRVYMHQGLAAWSNKFPYCTKYPKKITCFQQCTQKWHHLILPLFGTSYLRGPSYHNHVIARTLPHAIEAPQLGIMSANLTVYHPKISTPEQVGMTISESYITSNIVKILVLNTILGRPWFIILKVTTPT